MGLNNNNYYQIMKCQFSNIVPLPTVSVFFVCILLMSDVLLMTKIQKTGTDPGKSRPDPDPGWFSKSKE